MLHALYFNKDGDGRWNVVYNNRSHVQTETFKLEKQRNKPSFLPTVEGDSTAVLSAYLLNLVLACMGISINFTIYIQLVASFSILRCA